MPTLLYDPFGRPIEAKALRRPPTDERRGRPRLVDRWTFGAATGLTPRKLAQILREAETGDVRRQAELFGNIYERDAHVRAEMGKRISAVVGLPWEVSPADKSERAAEVAGFVTETLEGLKAFGQSQRRLCGAVGMGYALEELTWRLEGGRYLPGLHGVDPGRITFVNSLQPLLITDAEPTGAELEPFRFIYHRYESLSGLEARGGIYRTLAWYYLFKHHSFRDWMIFLETFGVPYRLGHYEASASDEDKKALAEAVRSLGLDGAGIISKEAEIEITEAASRTGASPHKVLIDICNAEMSKAILGQTLSAQVGEKGSYAAAKVHDQVRHDLLEDDAQALAETLRDQLVAPLVGFNFGWDAPMPSFYYILPRSADEIRADRELLGGALRDGFPVSLELYSERTGLRLPVEGETAMSVPAGQPFLAARAASAAGGEAHPLDGFVDLAVDRAAGLDLDGELKRIAAGAADEEELLERLGEIYGRLPNEKFQALLAKAMLLADLAGRARNQGDRG